MRNTFKEIQDKTWKLAESIVRRQYPQEDVSILAHYLQNKYENVDTIAKDSCFHFGYMGKSEKIAPKPLEENNEDDKYITKHFDFKIEWRH